MQMKLWLHPTDKVNPQFSKNQKIVLSFIDNVLSAD